MRILLRSRKSPESVVFGVRRHERVLVMRGIIFARVLHFAFPLLLLVVYQAVIGHVPLWPKFSKNLTKPEPTHETGNIVFGGLVVTLSEPESPVYMAFETLGEMVVGQVVGAREVFEIVGQIVATNLRDEVAVALLEGNVDFAAKEKVKDTSEFSFWSQTTEGSIRDKGLRS